MKRHVRQKSKFAPESNMFIIGDEDIRKRCVIIDLVRPFTGKDLTRDIVLRHRTELLLAGKHRADGVDCQRCAEYRPSHIAAKQIDSHPRVGPNNESGRFEKGEMKWQA